MGLEIDKIRAARSARISDRKLARIGEFSVTEIVCDVASMLVAATPSIQDHEWGEAIGWAGMAFVIMMLYHSGKIAWQNFRISGMDYEEVSRDINNRLRDPQVRRQINRYLN